MQILTRRAVLLGAGAIAAGTLAAVTLWRKPPPIHRPEGPPGGANRALQPDLAGLIARQPPAPPADLPFYDAVGGVHRLAEFRGKGVIVNLWATWCAPCVAEMPALQAMARALAPAGIVVLPLSSDIAGADAVRPFYAAHGIDALGVWLDPKGDVLRGWGGRGLPTTLIIDRSGREQGRVEGAVDWASPATEAVIRKLVG
ncbi:MAG: TlpA family protein disulfide reductase [Rhodospirillales bacterium]|nr:TlpA family protein disulfide reductase [Rhodospirillales bacterium]MDE2576865.1 TlpA family protein disulfide reductase [Rhodospirillales bacterium]